MPTAPTAIITIIITRITTISAPRPEIGAYGTNLALADGPSAGTVEQHQAAGKSPSPDNASLLYVWLSPSFPVGSFAFSHGMEWAVHEGQIRDAATTGDWIATLLDRGSLRSDVIIASCAWRAVDAEDATTLRDLSELSLALVGCRERHLETSVQAGAFLTALQSAWSAPRITWACDVLAGEETSYPVALAIGAAAHGIPRHLMLEAFALALVQNLVSATIRLSVIGQTDGQRIIARLMPKVRDMAAAADTFTLDDLGAAAFHSDIAAIKHETQTTRLFRS
ncbi:urease accessory UreF family protein [Hyphomicrobium sp. CS1GBMeth3]|uniref:urease accessory protein UreF n=1 Tax=Hyphomicrobium sp. CS1GBMeth3 TaxID=1892845 RepID=UPI0015C56C21|nr:urease accessory UreF family protein [Hyphomicrobium sp. CS1GBMeth3]